MKNNHLTKGEKLALLLHPRQRERLADTLGLALLYWAGFWACLIIFNELLKIRGL